MHHKVASMTSSQASFIRTGTQRAAYLGSIPNQPTRAPAPKQNTSAVGQRSSLKHGHSSSKKLNPTMSTSAISGSAAGSKSRQKSSKIGGMSTASYEPVLCGLQSHDAPSKKISSISMAGPGNTHKQPAQVGQAKHKYLSPVLRQGAPSKGYKS